MENLPNFDSTQSWKPVTRHSPESDKKSAKKEPQEAQNKSQIAEEILSKTESEPTQKKTIKIGSAKEPAPRVNKAIAESSILGGWKKAQKTAPEESTPPKVTLGKRSLQQEDGPAGPGLVKPEESITILKSKVETSLPQMDREKELSRELLDLSFGLDRVQKGDKKVLNLDKNNHFVVVEEKRQSRKETKAAYNQGVYLINQAVENKMFTIPIKQVKDPHIELSHLLDEIEKTATATGSQDKEFKLKVTDTRTGLAELKEKAASEGNTRTLIVPEKVKKELDDEYNKVQDRILGELQELNDAIKQKDAPKKEILEQAEKRVLEWKEIERAYIAGTKKMDNRIQEQLIDNLEIQHKFLADSKMLKEREEIKLKQLRKKHENLCSKYEEFQTKGQELAAFQEKKQTLEYQQKEKNENLIKAEQKLGSQQFKNLEDKVFQLENEISILEKETMTGFKKTELQNKNAELRLANEDLKRVEGAPQQLLKDIELIKKNLSVLEGKIQSTLVQIDEITFKISDLEGRLSSSEKGFPLAYKQAKGNLDLYQRNFEAFENFDASRKRLNEFIQKDVEAAADDMAEKYYRARRLIELPTKFPSLFSTSK